MAAAPVPEINRKILHISDLDPNVSSEDLIRAIRQEGFYPEYAKVRPGRKEGDLFWADVGFTDEADAARTLETLNHLTLGATEINIMYRRRPVGGLMFDPRCNVFVKGVPSDTQTTTLEAVFTNIAGKVVTIRLPRNAKNEIRGYGYILFESEEQAQRAIAHSGKDIAIEIQNGETEDEKETCTFNFQISPYIPFEQRTKSWTNMYVRGFPPSWTQEKLKEFASAYGNVLSIKLVHRDDLPAPYAFINFTTHDEAERFAELDRQSFEAEGENHIWYIRRHESKAARKNHQALLAKKGCNLFITGFPPETSQEKIEELFSSVGRVFSTAVFLGPMRSKVTKNYPRAYVMYEDPESAKAAVSALNGSDKFTNDQWKELLSVQPYQVHSAAIAGSFGKPLQTLAAPLLPQPQGYPHPGMMLTPSILSEAQFVAPIPMPYGAVPQPMAQMEEQQVPAEIIEEQLLQTVKTILEELVEAAEVEAKAEEIIDVLKNAVNPTEMPKLLASSAQLRKYIDALLDGGSSRGKKE